MPDHALQTEIMPAHAESARKIDDLLQSSWQFVKRGSIRIGTIRGVEVRIHALAFPLIIYRFSLIKFIVIILTLFIHEAGHAIAARRLERSVKGIVLIPPIGAATIGDVSPQEDPDGSRRIAAAGPLANLLVGVCLWSGIKVLGLTQGGGVYHFLNDLAFLNLIVGIANVIPIWPLDGGRMLYDEIRVRKIEERTVKVMTFWISFIAFLVASLWCCFNKIYFGLAMLVVLIIVAYWGLIKKADMSLSDEIYHGEN